jgi:hypothetical protein
MIAFRQYGEYGISAGISMACFPEPASREPAGRCRWQVGSRVFESYDDIIDAARQNDLFRSWLDQILNLDHALVW